VDADGSATVLPAGQTPAPDSVQTVINMIAALPTWTPVTMTEQDKSDIAGATEAIDAAQAAFDNLSAADKADVTNYNILAGDVIIRAFMSDPANIDTPNYLGSSIIAAKYAQMQLDLADPMLNEANQQGLIDTFNNYLTTFVTYNSYVFGGQTLSDVMSEAADIVANGADIYSAASLGRLSALVTSCESFIPGNWYWGTPSSIVNQLRQAEAALVDVSAYKIDGMSLKDFDGYMQGLTARNAANDNYATPYYVGLSIIDSKYQSFLISFGNDKTDAARANDVNLFASYYSTFQALNSATNGEGQTLSEYLTGVAAQLAATPNAVLEAKFAYATSQDQLAASWWNGMAAWTMNFVK